MGKKYDAKILYPLVEYANRKEISYHARPPLSGFWLLFDPFVAVCCFCSTFELISPKVVNSFGNFRSLSFASVWPSSLLFIFRLFSCFHFVECFVAVFFMAKKNGKKRWKSGSSIILFKGMRVCVCLCESVLVARKRARAGHQYNGKAAHRRFRCRCRRREFLFAPFRPRFSPSVCLFAFPLELQDSLLECVYGCLSVCMSAMTQQVVVSVASLPPPLSFSSFFCCCSCCLFFVCRRLQTLLPSHFFSFPPLTCVCLLCLGFCLRVFVCVCVCVCP